MTEQEFKDLRDEVEEAKAEAQKARGAEQQLLKQLKEQFNCASIEQARRKLDKLQREAERLKRELSNAIVAYNKRWKT